MNSNVNIVRSGSAMGDFYAMLALNACVRSVMTVITGLSSGCVIIAVKLCVDHVHNMSFAATVILGFAPCVQILMA